MQHLFLSLSLGHPVVWDASTSRTAGASSLRISYISNSVHFVCSRTYPGAGASRLSLYLSEIECSLTMAVYISKRLGSLARATYTCVRVLNLWYTLLASNSHFLHTCCANAQPSSSLFLSARLHFLTTEYLCCINRHFRSYVIPYYASKYKDKCANL